MIVYENSSIMLQCRKYKEIIEARSASEWAEILGIEYVDPSDLTATLTITFNPTKWWELIARATAVHYNHKTLRVLFPMENGEIAGLTFSEIKSMDYFGFFRFLIRAEFGRTGEKMKEKSEFICRGCGRPELHKLCPAWGTPFYMCGKVYTEEDEEKYSEQHKEAIKKARANDSADHSNLGA